MNKQDAADKYTPNIIPIKKQNKSGIRSSSSKARNQHNTSTKATKYNSKSGTELSNTIASSNLQNQNKVAELVKVLNNPNQVQRLNTYDSKKWIKTFCSEESDENLNALYAARNRLGAYKAAFVHRKSQNFLKNSANLKLERDKEKHRR